MTQRRRWQLISIALAIVLGFSFIVVLVIGTRGVGDLHLERVNNPAPGIVCIINCAREDYNYPSNTVRVFRDENNGVICYKEVGIGTNSGLTCVKE